MRKLGMQIPGKERKKYLLAAAILFFAFVNPYVEALEFSQPVPYMFAHYALFVSGMLLGYAIFRLPRVLTLLAAMLSVFWHLPYPFALAASLWPFRILSEASFLIAGILLGASLPLLTWRTKGILLGLWVFADNLLSVIFILAPDYYSSQGINISPYQNLQFPLLGLTMLLLMNSLVGVVVYAYTRRMVATIRSAGAD
ncbi:MAG: DUF1404 domain-containing protein [Conexivisphaerales archaeon]